MTAFSYAAVRTLFVLVQSSREQSHSSLGWSMSVTAFATRTETWCVERNKHNRPHDNECYAREGRRLKREQHGTVGCGIGYCAADEMAGLDVLQDPAARLPRM
jgi:hypothetical protein